MKRRNFFKTGAKGALAAGLLPIMGDIHAQTPSEKDRLLWRRCTA